MRILQQEVVTRYCVEFSPGETKALRKHPVWSLIIGLRSNGGGVTAAATLTKTQINQVCDVLGINGREFMQQHANGQRSSRWGVQVKP